jgi:hypothetical protein
VIARVTTTSACTRVTTTTAALVARVTTTTVSSRRTTTTLAAVALREPEREAYPGAPTTPTAIARATAAGPQGISSQDVEGLLQRYAAAWRRHDVDELRSIGQVNDDSQAPRCATAARVQDLEVEVRMIDSRDAGDRRIVRFTRLDRFRDPAGGWSRKGLR